MQKTKAKSVKVRESVSANYAIADVKQDPNLAEYKATCAFLVSHYRKGSMELFLALENARRTYLLSTQIGKELRNSRVTREIAKITGNQFHYPSNWED